MQQRVTQMLEAHPTASPSETLVHCIVECFTCAQACTSCADSSLAEQDVLDLVRVVRLDLDCADVCIATGKVLTRQTEFDASVARVVLEACVQTCRECAEECDRHAQHHEHCRLCAEACRRCEQACVDLLSALG
jgi:hypothetical protein